VTANKRSWILLSWPVFLLATASACGQTDSSPDTTTPAATVEARVTESSLTTITLTAEAEARLGIETAEVDYRPVTRTRTVGGSVMASGGSELTVTAPFAGTLHSPTPAVVVGTTVPAAATVFNLVPLAASDRNARIEADQAVAEAVARQKLAATRTTRAEKLAVEESGSQRAAEEAAADLAVADAVLKAARDRLALATGGVTASGGIALVAPYDAVLRSLHAGPGQTVAAGAPLFDLVGLKTVWVRAPLYAGDLETVDRSAAAMIVPLGSPDTFVGQLARPVAGPPSADAATAAVDLYFALDNSGRSSTVLRPGQRVSVRLPLVNGSQSLVVPYAAILHDAYGGTWVYEARPNHVFVRRRVSVVDIAGETAVLAQGPAQGTRIVTMGAAELFGTEFGVGK